MNGLHDIIFNIGIALGINVGTATVLSLLLFLIKVPNTEYSRKISKTKNTIATCFCICSILFYTCLKYIDVPNFEVLASMMMFVVTTISSAILSFSLINLLDESFIENDKFWLNIGLVAITSIIFIRSFWMKPGTLRLCIHAGYIAIFTTQCIIHIIAYRKRYREGLKKIQNYYDEDESKKLLWIHFCYIIMMLTQMFILVYRLFPTGFMKIYNVWYALFMVYFTANLISFIGSHKITLDAFAYKTMTGLNLDIKIKGRTIIRSQSKKLEKVEKPSKSAESLDFKKLEAALEKWVEQKKFSEYDKSREDIAKELGTSREFLHLYFTTKKGVDFKTWRTQLRVEEAKRLLLENREVSANVIGEIAGFSDRSNFYRQFMKLVGCSPKQWRESNGKI